MAKLLLVEDDNNLREIYEARLTAEGYDITTAQNGEEALSVAKDVHPDLIISDVMMPRISGFEMLDILRNTDELKNTKIIMLTALGQAEDRGRADNLGADKYLVKSQVTLEDIVKAAEELLNGDSETVAPAPAPAVEEPAVAPETTVEPTMPAPEAPAAVVEAPSVEPAAAPVPVADVPAVAAPTTASPMPTPVEPAVVSAPSDQTAAIPVAAPVDTTAPQIADPDVSQTPPAEPVVAPVSATVTVADPDPIVAAPIEVVAAPPTEPVVTAETVDSPVVASEPVVTSEAETLAAEEAAIEQQIASFATPSEEPALQAAPVPSVPSPTPAVTMPSPDSVSNDAVLAQAVSELTSTTVAAPAEATAPTEPVPAPTPTPELTPAPAPTPQPDTNEANLAAQQQVTGHKIIQPLDGVATSTPNLEELLAAEDAKESAQAVPTPQAVPVAGPAEPPKPAIDPNTIAL